MTGFSIDSQVGTSEVREKHRFDVAALEAWMAANVAGFQGPLTVEQFKGGQSNPTYKLLTPSRDYVLRRKPPGELLAGAHAVDREARVLFALAGSGVPVAHVHGLCTDENVIGTWFFIMDFVDGRIVWDATFPDVPRDERPAYFDAMNAAIAALHRVDPDAVGLSDYGRPGNYFARQIARWSRQYVEDTDAGRDPHLDRLIEWLPTAIPEGDETRVVHGDFRSDNMIFHPTEPRILAVLDWELSTLGHPLADFAYHCMTWRMPPGPSRGMAGLDLPALGIPTEEEYLAAYCRRTGRADISRSDWEYYMVFNMFRLTGILQGIMARALQGNASSAEAMAAGKRARPLAELAWQLVERIQQRN